MPGTPILLDQQEHIERAQDANDEDFDYLGRIKSFRAWDIGFFDLDGRGLLVETKENEEGF